MNLISNLGPRCLLGAVLTATLVVRPAPGQDAEVAHQGAITTQFEKVVLTPQYFCDGVAAGDIDRDGHGDIVAGPYWYAGPTFRTAHAFYPAVPLEPAASPSNSMYSFVHDFNGDGWLDILVLGRVHLHAAYWYENPGGGDALWKKHYAFERVQGESPLLIDLDGDGRPQVVCHWEGHWGWIEPDWQQPTDPWRFCRLSQPGDWKEFYHGTGVGDLDGDGRLDLILNDGWFQQPDQPGRIWNWHPQRFSAERGGAQMLIYDVDGDGDHDVVSSLDAHGWGLAWFEQQQEGGEVVFRQHLMMGTREEIDRYGVAFTQPHALALGDLNGDGLLDVVVGKRRWAHGPQGDIEPAAAPVLYWFELQREAGTARFQPHLIDDESGVGVQITIADVDGNGTNDILTASKLGTFLFRNRR